MGANESQSSNTEPFRGHFRLKEFLRTFSIILPWNAGKLKKLQPRQESISVRPKKNASNEEKTHSKQQEIDLVKCPEIDFSNLYDDSCTLTNFSTQYAAKNEPSKEEKKLSSWREFNNYNSFHGVWYIFDKKPYKLRRLLWLLVVLVCMGLFSYQVIDRTRTYFRYLSNVNVEVIYVDVMDFPAVTICNQNNFSYCFENRCMMACLRITAAVDRGMFYFIDSIFSSENIGVPEVTQLIAPEENLTSFILETAHQRHDFIDSCLWRGKKCNITEDFEIELTDFGVCYTFNAGNSTRDVYKAGSGYALNLILNVEQYEYMKGPQDEAGVKVLLHDPAEVPQVKNHGFAMAPGTHTLVAVSRQVVKSLEEPHGHCKRDSQPRSRCQAMCLAQEVARVCGCVDFYMPAVASMTREEQTCVCDVPCDRVVYEPELSYAHLSKLSKDRTSLGDSEKHDLVQRKYGEAREVAARVNRNIAEQDITMLNDILLWFHKFSADVEHSNRALSNEEYLTEVYGVSDISKHGYPLITNDFPYIRNEYNDKGYAALFKHPRVYSFPSLIHSLTLFLEVMNGISPLEIRLGICAKEEGYASLVPLNETHFFEPAQTFNECDDRLGSETYLSFKKHAATTLSQYSLTVMADILNMIPSLETTLDYVYGNSTVDIKKNSSYEECIEVLTNQTKYWHPFVETMHDLTAAYILPDATWREKYNIYLSLASMPNQSYTNASLSNSKNFVSCNWFVLKSYTDITSGRNFGLFLAHTGAAEKAFLDARSIMPPLEIMSKFLHEELTAKDETLFGPIIQFFERNQTKMDLFHHFDSPSFKVEWEKLKLSEERYMADFQQFASKLADLGNNMVQSYFYAFNLPVPMLNDTVISNLELTRYAQARADDDSEYGNFLSIIKSERERALNGLVKVIFGKYRESMKAVQTKILQSFNELQEALTKVREELEEYAKGNEMNEAFFVNNYIKVDIFFKELSYELVNQQVSFEFLSLISEIGGFMGLLLGASVLTVCELIDYLAVVTLRRCNSKSLAKEVDDKN